MSRQIQRPSMKIQKVAMKNSGGKADVRAEPPDTRAGKCGPKAKPPKRLGAERHNKMEPTIGLEPMTCRLRIDCSTN